MNRRVLLIAVLVIVIIVALITVVLPRVTSSSSGKGASGTPTPSGAKTPGTSIAEAGTPLPTSTHGPTARRTPGPLSPQMRALHAYAGALVPVVTRSVKVFNSVSSQASGTSNLSKLNTVCFGNLKRLGVVQAQAEGVPHPYAWYTPVGKFHHHLMGIYHIMVGATDACATAASNGQASDASIAVSTMNKTARGMRNLKQNIMRLSKLPK